MSSQLIGRKGTFVLTGLFTKLAPNGATGEIEKVSYITHEVALGVDVKTAVYAKVGAEAIYQQAVNTNVIIVDIKMGNGNVIRVPDNFIENLYDDGSHYVDAYVTVKVGRLPANYDFSTLTSSFADAVGKATGLPITSKDVAVSISGKSGTVMTTAQSALEDAKRAARIADSTTTFQQLQNALANGQTLTNQVNTLQTIISTGKNILGGG